MRMPGTMVLTLPILIGAWIGGRGARWHTLFGIAIVSSLLGVFMAAARVHTVVAALVLLTATFSGGMGVLQRFRWAIALGLVVWVVGGDARLQRFTSLSDTSMIAERFSGSVNEGFFDVISEYPLGNGLASGGTSVPYLLQSQRARQTNTVIEKSTRGSRSSRDGQACSCGWGSSPGHLPEGCGAKPGSCC